MARRQRHPANFARVPRSDDLAARIGVLANELDEVRDLVDVAPVRCLPVPPLLAVDRSEIAVLVSPFVPDSDRSFLKPANVGVAAQEPQQYDDDRAQVKLLGRQQRESFRKVEAHLRAEPRQGAGSRAVLLLDSAVEDELHQVEILAHGGTLTRTLGGVQEAATHPQWTAVSETVQVGGRTRVP